MPELNRRDLIKRIGTLLPAGAALALTTDARAQQPAPPAPVPAPAVPATPPPLPASSPLPPPNNSLDEQKAREFIASVKPAVAMLEVVTERGIQWGSGFFVSSDGLFITNRHVVDRGQKFTCIYKNREKLSAQVLKIDAQYDLALLQVAVKGEVPTVTLGDSEAVATGSPIAVTGYPEPLVVVWLGMALDSSTSRGSVNGLRYSGDSNSYVGETALQIDAPVTHGNSGGPVFRVDTGEVVGVLTRGMTSGAQNLTLAVPSNPVKTLISSAGKTLKPKPVAHTDPLAVVESGELRILNTISVSKELPVLFGYNFPIVSTTSQDENTARAVSDWRDSTGLKMPAVSPMFLQKNEMFFGSTDGRLRRWDVSQPTQPAEVLLDAADGTVFAYGPVVSDQIICAVSGSLDLSSEMRTDTSLGSVLGSMFGFGSRPKEAITIDGVGHVFGLNRRNGNIDWQIDTGFVGTPVLYNDRVYYGGIGERGCLDIFQGKEIWREVQREGAKADWFHIGYAGKLGVYGIGVQVEGKRKDEENKRLRLYGNGKARVERYDPESKKVLWRRDFGDIKDRLRPLSTAMFVDEKKGVIYALAAQVIAAVDASDGKLRWMYDQQKAAEEEMKKRKDKDAKIKARAVSFTSNMLIQDDIVYIGSTDHKLHAFNGADGKELWVYPTRGEVGTPSYHDGQLFFGSTDGYIHVIDAHTGTLNWRVQTNSPVRSQPLIKSGMVYAPTEDGTIYTVRIPVA